MSRIQDANIVEGRQKVFRVAKRSLLTVAIIIILIVAATVIYREVSKKMTTVPSQKTFNFHQTFEVDVPTGTLVGVKVLFRKSDIIKIQQTGPLKVYFLVGDMNDVEVRQSLYQERAELGNERDTTLFIRGGEELVHLIGRIIPYN